jgi:hypothetical protein
MPRTRGGAPDPDLRRNEEEGAEVEQESGMHGGREEERGGHGGRGCSGHARARGVGSSGPCSGAGERKEPLHRWREMKEKKRRRGKK